MSQIEVHKIEGKDLFVDSKASWKLLFAESDCSPFSSWEWLSTWFESFGQDKVPVIFKAYRANRLIGILPMLLENAKFSGMGITRLSMIGAGPGGADHLDVIANPDDREVAAAAIFDHIRRNNLGDVTTFESLPADSVSAVLLRDQDDAITSKLERFSEAVTASCPQIDLTVGWAAVLDQCKRKENFKRRLRKLEKMDGFEFRSVSDPAETSAAFERFLRLHQLRWESSGGSELSGHPRLIAFQRQAVAELSQIGMIRFDELWTDGECRASVYGLDNERTFYYYNSGYDTDFGKLSVGLVLLGLSIRNAIDRGNTVYDFLRGEETYKFDWANRTTDLVTIALSRHTLPVVLDKKFGQIATAIETAAKAALPSGFRQAIANWRRAWKRNYQLSE